MLQRAGELEDEEVFGGTEEAGGVEQRVVRDAVAEQPELANVYCKIYLDLLRGQL